MKKAITISIIVGSVLVFVFAIRYVPKKECVQLGASRDEFTTLTDRVIAKDPTITDVDAENFMQLYNRNNANIIRFNEFIRK